jgi:subtilase family serine protease
VVQGTIHPKVKMAADLGEAPADKALDSLSLRFSMTSAQSAALSQLLADQQNPSSPRYHQWLTPEQFGAEFGMSQNDLASATSWLQEQGFTVTGVARGRTFINFSGTVGQVNRAFAANMHAVSLNGETHIANLSDPSLPTALANVTAMVGGLNDFRVKPRARQRSVEPKFNGGAGNGNLIAPGDFYTIYDLNPLISSSINGSGVSIAVTGQTDIGTAGLASYAAFRSAAGLSTTNPPTIQLAGRDPGSPGAGIQFPTAGDLSESMLDLEWAGAAAPGANIIFITGQDVFLNAQTQAIDNKVAPIITTSYGNCESNFGNAEIASLNVLYQQANAQGQTILGPAGDAGAADCEIFTNVSASTGLAVDFPASSPYATGVGGTEFNENGTNYFSTANGNNGGTATSYIPEQPWNETFLTSSGGQLYGLYYGGAGGGGVSQIFSKPAWQVGNGVPADASRDVPDIAFNAAAQHDGYLVCVPAFTDSTGKFYPADCTSGFANSSGAYDIYGGTSVGTPSFAGILAMLEQKLQVAGLGNVNPKLYGLANSSYYSTVFHDVTSGTNAVPCTLGSTDCSAGYPGFNPAGTIACPANSCTGFIAYPSIGYSATTGYDLASGWGSIDVNNLVNDWLLAPAVGVVTSTQTASTTTVSATPANVVAGAASVTVTATIASSSSSVTTTPTGTATLLVDNAVVGTAVALSGTTVTFPAYATTTLSSGPHTFSVSYSGDGTYAGSKGSASVDVTSPVVADFSVTPATATVTVASGGTAAGVTYTVTPLNGFTGSVSFSATASDPSLAATYSFSVSPVVISGTATGTTVFTLEAFQSNTGAAVQRFNAAPSGKASLGKNPWALGGSGIVVAGLLFFGLPRQRRNRWSALMVALVSVGVLSAAGCSGSAGSGTNGTTKSAPGTYAITVTAQGQDATGTVHTHNVSVSFVVQ